MEDSKNYFFNVPDYKKAIQNSTDFFLQFSSMDSDVEAVLSKTVRRWMESLDLMFINDHIIKFETELIHNAVKANIKRLYFREKGLNINTVKDYRTGMETFKEEAICSGKEKFNAMLKDANLIVRIFFKNTDDYLHISTINNCPALDIELDKINARISKAYRYKNISQAFDDVVDDSEDSGLGLIVNFFILKSIGFPSKAFRVYRKDNLTIATLSVPKHLNVPESENRIAEIIVNEINSFPAFPKTILKIQELCRRPDEPIKNIADAISRDVGLTASLLRLANSAGFAGIKRTDSVEEAIIKIGIKSLTSILIASGIDRIMEHRFSELNSLWREAYTRASYAKLLAEKLNRRQMADPAYLISLLCDVGRISITAINNDTLDKLIRTSRVSGNDTTPILEEMALGISHAKLGSLICRKWHFSETISQVIEFHLRPFMAPDHIKEPVYLTYLANMFINMDKDKTGFNFIDEEVLDWFSINDEKKFDDLRTAVKNDAEKLMSEEDRSSRDSIQG